MVPTTPALLPFQVIPLEATEDPSIPEGFLFLKGLIFNFSLLFRKCTLPFPVNKSSPSFWKSSRPLSCDLFHGFPPRRRNRPVGSFSDVLLLPMVRGVKLLRRRPSWTTPPLSSFPLSPPSFPRSVFFDFFSICGSLLLRSLLGSLYRHILFPFLPPLWKPSLPPPLPVRCGNSF